MWGETIGENLMTHCLILSLLIQSLNFHPLGNGIFPVLPVWNNVMTDFVCQKDNPGNNGKGKFERIMLPENMGPNCQWKQ